MVYVLDTSVFLSDPKALERLASKDIVIPLVVVTELEGKRNHPELGYAARETLRTLESYRKQNGLTEKIKTIEGGSIRIEINNIEDSLLPEALKSASNDNKILAVASNLSRSGKKVTLLTKDLPLRIKASVAGIKADSYQEDTIDCEWPKVTEIEVNVTHINDLYSQGSIDNNFGEYPINTNFILRSETSSALGRLTKNNKIKVIRENSIFDVRGRSAEQRFAIDMLTDDKIGIVSLGGKAGTGKSLIALAAALDSVVEQRKHKKVVVFRPLYAVGGQDLGFLPGTEEEKMAPWAAAVFDALEVFCGPNVLEEVIEENLLEVLPLTHIRGRTLTDTYVIIDEAQNLEKMVLLTALTRMGNNSKVVLTHDVAQRDNLRVGKHDGISSVVSALAGNSLFGHISLTRSERSAIAELVANLIEI